MQRCPKCGRTYEHDTQKFCTHDGGRLAPDDPSVAPTTYDLNQATLTDPYDPEATVTRMPDLNKTVASAPTSEIRSKETGPATAPPASPYQPPPPQQPTPPQPPTQQPTVAFNQSPPSQPPQQFYQPPPPAQQQHQAQAPMPPQHQQQQYAPAQLPQQQQHAPQRPAAARKSSRLPLIIGLVVALLVGGAAAWYFLIYKKGNAAVNANSNSNVANSNTNANANATANANDNANTSANANTTSTPTPQPPPPNSTQFVNSRTNLDGKLAEKYSDFSFYYPNTWERDPKSGAAGASNFIRVERRLPPDFTQENFAVSWYDSQGTLEADQEKVFPKLVESLKAKLSKAYPEFEVLSEGGTTINALNGYELRFKSVSRGTEKGDITLWGWVVFLPPGKEGETNGLQLLMLTTSLAPELQSASDVGVKGELPMILNSFRMGSGK
jgi:flagellar basal body-associated protein FliL